MPATKTFTAQLVAIALIAQALGPFPGATPNGSLLPAAVEEVLGDSEPAERAASSLGRPTSWWRSDAATSCASPSRPHQAARGRPRARRGLVGGRLPARAGDRRGRRSQAAGGERGRPAAADVEELAASLEQAGTPVLRLADRSGVPLPYPAGLAEPLAAIPAVVRAQQLALALALRRGVDPDEPPGPRKVTPTR